MWWVGLLTAGIGALMAVRLRRAPARRVDVGTVSEQWLADERRGRQT
jgi:hypothetical protein